MSDLSFLEKLLDGADVEWKPLGKITEYSKERTSADELDSSTYVGVDNLLQNRAGRIDSNYVPASGNLTRFQIGDILIGNIRPYLRKIWLSDRIGGTNGDVLVVHPTDEVISSRYLFQVLTDERFFEYNIQHSKGAKMPRGSKPEILRFLVPIPCPDEPEKSLAIQREIVRILDSFTELIAELTAELELRKKQYNHYRDQLLTFEEGDVEWKQLGEICIIGDGNHSSKYPKSSEMVSQGIPFIRGTNFINGTLAFEGMKFISEQKHKELKKGHLKPNDVLITNRGEVGKVAFVPEHIKHANLNSQLAWLRAEPTKLSSRYLFHALNSAPIQNSITGEGGALQQLTIKNIKLIRMPVPSLDEQTRIVAILDKFDTLTTSLSEGLPREIELRQKQYEYYRDLLLSFPEPADQSKAAA